MCVLGVGWDKYMCVCWGWGGISTCVCVGGWGGISTCVCGGGWGGISTCVWWGWGGIKHSVDYDE